MGKCARLGRVWWLGSISVRYLKARSGTSLGWLMRRRSTANVKHCATATVPRYRKVGTYAEGHYFRTSAERYNPIYCNNPIGHSTTIIAL